MTDEQAERRRIAKVYTAFAVDEARGWSGIYERLALAVAGSDDLLAFIATLPAERRQPNLFLAAVRQVRGVPESADHLAAIVRKDAARIRAVMLARTTQTNEPGRCAVLLPVLARLPQPLALLEVGASAGLCLLPDHYGYDYGSVRIAPAVSTGGKPPVFACKVAGALPLPSAVPRIAWRCGLDLNPVDVHSPDAVQWLETLVWPEQEERAQRLRAAVAIARRAAPRVVKGDLMTDLEPLMAAAPKEATLVAFHTAVLGYVASPAARDRFAAMMRAADVVWISNEVPGVFPAFAAGAPASPRRRFLLAVNGRPLAWTGPHGQSIDWFGSL
ncbi:MAG TPA: DUF2332 domain-containing protein [Xanthobacteraceae bacterium]|nr:DUF2332 domain-containing protein [Xanthobacteraceae bacterium]